MQKTELGINKLEEILKIFYLVYLLFYSIKTIIICEYNLNISYIYFNVYMLYLLGFPSGSMGKESTCNAGDTVDVEFSPWVGKIPLEEGMAIHSSILAWRLPWTEESGYSP